MIPLLERTQSQTLRENWFSFGPEKKIAKNKQNFKQGAIKP
jgi:hypothetical protein